MDEKVFIYLRLVLGDEVLAKSKIRELADDFEFDAVQDLLD